MSSLSQSSNQILQPNIAGGANPSNAHFTNAYGSKVGGVSGCAGAGNSPAALAAKPGYNWVKMHHHQKGGAMSHHRGGNKRSHKRSGHKRSNKKRSSHKKRGMRGGLSALSPASFSGAANLPYNQFTGNQPLSFTYDTVGPALSPANSGLASPHIGTANNACAELKLKH